MQDRPLTLPTAAAIHEQLTLNERERRRLRALLEIVRAEEEDRRQTEQQDPNRPKGVKA
jgi:hypothetical protein